jgi:hypothetical protein
MKGYIVCPPSANILIALSVRPTDNLARASLQKPMGDFCETLQIFFWSFKIIDASSIKY